MLKRVNVLLAVAIMICMIPAAAFALVPYSQDFEALNQASTSALTDDGWLVFANVFGSDGGYWYGYGVFGAPNDGGGFCQIAIGEGGGAQGSQQLNVFSDYNNADHANGATIEANVFQEQVVDPGNIGQTWVYDFQAKMANLEGSSTAAAFIKTLDPNNGWATTNFIAIDMTSTPADWTDYSASILIDASLAGQILQIGFMNTATNYEGSGVFYDNINFNVDGAVSVEAMSFDNVKALFR
jgi:hypothetical protein